MIEDIYNYRRLSEALATAGQPKQEQLAEIAAAGFQLVINLAMGSSDRALPDEPGSVRALGMAYVHIPVVWEQPTLADLQSFFAILEAHREKKVFVHCYANMRVSVFMALYRILRLNWPVEQAFAEVYPIWTPNPTWQAFIDQALTRSGEITYPLLINKGYNGSF